MNDTQTIELTTEELGLLSTGKTLTFAVGEELFHVRADDLDCTTRELAEGRTAKAGELLLSYKLM